MRRTGRLVVPLLAALALTLMVGASTLLGALTPFAPLAPQPVAAAGANGLTVSKSVDGDPLIGGTMTYTVKVKNDSYAAGMNNPDGKAYNLDITDVLPIGTKFVSATTSDGSSPSPSISTAQIVITPGMPMAMPPVPAVTAPQQTLKFTNLTDIARNQTFTLTYIVSLAVQSGNYGVTVPGTILTNAAAAKVTNDPRAAASDSAGNDAATATALPFKLDKVAVQSTGVSQDTGGCPGAVGEGRGYTYKLTATNNKIGPSTGLTITDTLPDGVEYCGDSAGDLMPMVTKNPNGTTTLVYGPFDLATNGVRIVQPKVAIRYTFQSNNQIIPDYTKLTNTAKMSGTYSGTVYNTGDKTADVSAHYATIAKGDDKGTVMYGDTINYTLTPSTSTNYNISNEYVIDTLPDGQEWIGNAKIGATAFPPTDGAKTDGVFTPCAGFTALAAGVYSCPDGTTQITWGKINDTALTPTTAGTQYTITFQASVGQPTTSYNYKHGTGGRIFATDSFTNTAKVIYDAASIAGHASQPNSVTQHFDNASAGQTTRPPSIAKVVSAVTLADGTATPTGEGKVTDPHNSTAAVGDITTFVVTYTGSPDADQKNIVVADFLPTNYTYVDTSAVFSGSYITNGGGVTPTTSTTAGARLQWALTGVGMSNITPKDAVFVVTFKAQSTGGNAGNGNTNLAKFTGVNTVGTAYSGRDVTNTTTLAPKIVLTKTNDAPSFAKGNDTFTYTVTLSNTGTSTAYQLVDLTDKLPPDVQYTSFTSVTPAGAYSGPAMASGFGDTITFTHAAALKLAPGQSITIKYAAKIKPNPNTATVDINDVTLASYVSQPSGTLKTYGPVQATSPVTIGSGTVSKDGVIHTPQVNETAGKALTIGDQVDYTINAVIPADQVFQNGKLTDCLPVGFRYVSGSYSVTTSRALPGPGAFPANDTATGFAKAAGTGNCAANREAVTIDFGTQSNAAPNTPTTPIVVTVKLSAVITPTDLSGAAQFVNVPSTQSDANDAYLFAGNAPQGEAHTPPLTVYRPSLTLAKSLLSPTTPTVKGGVNIDFLVTLTNSGGSPAYDVAPLIDTLDPGLLFAGAFQYTGGACTATAFAGASAAGQVITLPVPGNTLAANTTLNVCVRAQIAPPAAPSTVYKNGVTLGTGTGVKYYSAPATFPNRAGYTQNDNPTAQVKTPDVTVLKGEKSGRPNPDGKAAPGEVISFTLQFTIPRGTVLYTPTITDNYDFGQMNPQFITPTDTTSGKPNLSCTNGASGAYTFNAPVPANGNKLSYSFAGNLSASGSGDAVCTLQYDTKVANIKPQNVVGLTATNPSFTIAFKDNKGGAVAPVTSNPASVTIVEPNVSITKTTAGFGPDGRATYVITITNATGANIGAASDITITDNLPAGVIYVTSSFSGDAVNPSLTVSPGTLAQRNNLVFKADSLALGKSETLNIVVVSDITPPPGTTITNTANLKYYDLPSGINGNNNQADPQSRREYTGTASVPLVLPRPMGLHFVWSFVNYTTGDCVNPGSSVDVYARIVDTNADIVDSPRLTYLKPNEAASSAGSFANFTRVTGDRRDGIYKATINLDQYSPAGVYKIKELYAYDTMNGIVRQDINDAVSVSSPIKVCTGGPGGGGGSCQMANGMYIPLQITTPTTITYPNGQGFVQPGQSATLTMHITSCPGVIDPSIEFVKPDGSAGPRGDFTLKSGTMNDGIWTTTVLFDQYAPSGTYKVRQLKAFDQYTTATLQSVTAPVDAVAASLNVLVGTLPPTITSISPDSGPVGGGTLVTIIGTGFREGATVKFGTATGVDPHVFDGGLRITVLAPNLPTGAVAVIVTNPDGQGTSGAAPGGGVAPRTGGMAPTYSYVQANAPTRAAGTTVPATAPAGGSATATPAPQPATRAAAATATQGPGPRVGETPTATPIPAPMRR